MLTEALGAPRLPTRSCIMVNRNPKAQERAPCRSTFWVRPAPSEGYWNQPRSHNAVAAAVAQGRADWGITIAPVAGVPLR